MKILTITFLVFLLIFIASCKETFVSSSGNRSEDTIFCGNKFNPCRTIRYAILKSSDGDVLFIDSGEHYISSSITINHSITIRGNPHYFIKINSKLPTIYFVVHWRLGLEKPTQNIFTCYGNISISGLNFAYKFNYSPTWVGYRTWFYVTAGKKLILVEYCYFNTENPLQLFNMFYQDIAVGDNTVVNIRHSKFKLLLETAFDICYINILGFMHITVSNQRFLINNTYIYRGSMNCLNKVSIANSYFKDFRLSGISDKLSVFSSTFQDSTMSNGISNITFFISQCIMYNSYMYFTNVVEGTLINTTFKNIHYNMASPAIRLVMENFPQEKYKEGSIRIIRCLFENISLVKDVVPVISIHGDSKHSHKEISNRLYIADTKVTDLSNEITILNAEGTKDTVKNLSVYCGSGHFISFFNNKNHKLEKIYRVLLNCISCKRDYYNLYGEINIINKKDNGKVSFKYPLNHQRNCFICPSNGKCENGKIISKGAYWGYNETLNKIKFLLCPTYYCCPTLKKCFSYNTCASNRQGRLCSDCLPGFSCSLNSDYRCVSNKFCQNQTKGFALLFIVSVLFVLILLFQKEITSSIKFFKKAKEDDQPDQCDSGIQTSSDLQERLIHMPSYISDDPVYYQELTSSIDDIEQDQYRRIPTITSGSIKIFFFFYQAASIIRIQSAGKLNILFPRFFDFLSTFFSIRIDVSYSKIPLCMMSNLSVIHTEILKSSIIFISLSLIFLIGIVTFIYCLIKGYNLSPVETFTIINEDVPSYCKMPMLTRLKCTYLQFLLISFAGIATFSFRAVYCIKINGISYLYQQASIKCYQSWQYFIIFGISTWIIPFPVVLYIASKLLHQCQITPNKFIAAMTFPPIIIPILVNVKLNPQGGLTKKDAMDAKHLLLVINEPFRESGEQGGNRICWEIMLILRRMLLIVMNTFILSPITKLYPIAMLLLAYTFQHYLSNSSFLLSHCL